MRPSSLRHAAFASLLVASLASISPWAPAAAAPASSPSPAVTPSARADTIRAWIDGGHFAEADSAAHELLRQAEREHGAESIEAARALDLIVASMQTWPESLPFAERAVHIRESLPGHDDEGNAGSWMNLGRVLARSGKYHEARAALEEASAARERAFGPDDLFLATILNNLAYATEEDGDARRAKPLYERAIDIRVRKLPPNDLLTAGTYTNLGRLCGDLGDFEEGEGALRKSLAIQTVMDGGNPSYIAPLLLQLGILQYRMGNYATARSSLEQALPTLEAAGADSVALANALLFLGLVHRDTGDYARARLEFERTLRIRKRLFGDGDPEVAVSLEGLGELYERVGDYAAAKPLLERTLSIRRDRLGKTHVNTGLSLLGLSRLLGEIGSAARAESLCSQGISILRMNYGEKHHLVAGGLAQAALLRLQVGDADSALSLYQDALSIQEQILGRDHPDAAVTRLGLARTFWRLGRRDEALGAALRSEAAAREQLRLTERTLSEREALGYAATRTTGLGLAFSIARNGLPDRLDREIWDALIRARASVLDEMAWRNRAIATAGDTIVAGLSGRMVAASTRLSNLMVRGPSSDPGRYQGMVTAARESLEASQRILAERSQGYREQRSAEDIGLSDVTQKLSAGAALVGFVRYDRADSTESAGSRAEYMAFVLVGATQGVSVIPLGSAQEIESRVSRFLAEAGPGSLAKGRPVEEAERICRQDGAKLRRLIWDPLVPAIGRASIVLIVPDAALSLVPFAALPVGPTAYLLETGPTIHYLSAERDVATPEDSSRRGNSLLALGGPDFDQRSLFASLRGSGHARAHGGQLIASAGPLASSGFRGAHSSCLEFQSVRFRPLPASGTEARDIAALWRRRRLPVAGLLTGATASEGEFKARARDAGVLHIASHGFFLEGECASLSSDTRGIGGIAFESRPPGSYGEEKARVTTRRDVENPLLLCGLAFAGANHRDAAADSEDDGILTAEEIATLDLAKVRWAVLSACDTGQGRIAAGEGVLGLRRAFQIAGVGSLIMSLWDIEDRAALQWMQAFYDERLANGRPMADSVRRASLSVLRARRMRGLSTHPSYWAGFVATGDWK